jgi:NAD-dependent dihydropyrimidine dehydrogenase PreA subunit
VAYIITEPCIGTKDTACVDVCPVDCIHPAKSRTYDDGRPTFDKVPQLYIDPTECIDCGCFAGSCHKSQTPSRQLRNTSRFGEAFVQSTCACQTGWPFALMRTSAPTAFVKAGRASAASVKPSTGQGVWSYCGGAGADMCSCTSSHWFPRFSKTAV